MVTRYQEVDGCDESDECVGINIDCKYYTIRCNCLYLDASYFSKETCLFKAYACHLYMSSDFIYQRGMGNMNMIPRRLARKHTQTHTHLALCV